MDDRKHQFIRWNEELAQWFCIKCGRTSDHVKAPDAREELEQFKCELPALDRPVYAPDDYRS
jgi:hypothetical protein